MMMKKYLPAALLAAALAACGGGEPAADAALMPPKPGFTVKFIDIAVLAPKLPLGEPVISEGEHGEKTYRYPVKGLPEGNFVAFTGKFPENMHELNGQCMEDAAAGWAAGGVCRDLFDKLAAAITAKPDEVGKYMLEHAGLQPVSERQTYAAVQDGRFVFDADRKGAFSLRRRH